MSELYRDFIDSKANQIINSLGGTITPAPANAELYRDFLDRKFDDVINSIDNVLPIGSATGNPATFYTSVSKPLVACTTEFMSTQEGTGDPSPSNPRAIVGVDDITLNINENTVVIDLDGTRYGGYVDVVNRKLLNNMAFFDKWDNVYLQSVNQYGIANYLIGGLNLNPNAESHCSTLPIQNTPITDTTTEGYYLHPRYIYIRVDTTRLPTRNDFITWANQNLQVCATLTTPIEISLSDIPTLLTIIGNNSFASDTGNIDIKYRCLPIDLI